MGISGSDNLKKHLPAIGWSIIILILCLLPKSDLPDDSWINIPHFDKLVHFGLFFVLFLTLRFASPERWFVNILICVAYGCAIEIAQEIAETGRSAEWFDLLADAIGATFAAAIALIVRRRPLV